MSRSRKQHGTKDENEQLREENRELKSTIKSLERQLKKLNKEYKSDLTINDLIQEEYDQKKPKLEKCPKCERGHLQTVELGPKKLITCSVCDEYRKLIK